ARVLDLAAGIARNHLGHPGYLLERFLGAPEAGHPERRLFRLLRLPRAREREHQNDDQPPHPLISLRTASTIGWSRKHSLTLRSGAGSEALRQARAQISGGTAKMPLETAGKATDCQPFSKASLKEFAKASKRLRSSSPSPQRGPTAWNTPL